MLTLLLALHLLAEMPPTIGRIDPPHWWANMDVDTLELLVEGDLQGASIRIEGKGVRMLSSMPASNPRYHYVRLDVQHAVPQQLRVISQRSGSSDSATFELRRRDTTKHQRIGLGAGDVMYLIMADRFANGNPSNDVVASMRENASNRNDPYGRHGGDINGIRDHLNDLDSLGITALWMCPLLENDQPRSSYHGYAITDHYRIDPRFGSNAEYVELVRDAHQRNMRVVMDVVYNHVGSFHRLFLAPPDSSWFNWWSQYTQTNARETSLYDPYAAPSDKKRFTRGWFDRAMPDVNGEDPHAARYLLQNTIWWIEEADVDALRVDTYTYPDQAWMSNVNATLRRVFPGLFIFGETWVDSHASQAYYVEKFPLNPNTHLPGTTDFQVYNALRDVLTKTSGWDEGVGRLYRVLAGDYLYANPMNQVIFLDNHDLPRIRGVVDKDMNKLRMGLVMLYTLRGIPCITYGTEAAMHDTKEHGTIRQDMPGGWPADSRSVWSATQRTNDESLCYELLAKLGGYRRSSKPLRSGRLMQFAPDQGLYAYVRYTETEAVVVVVNADAVPRSLDVSRLDDVLRGERKAFDVLVNTQRTLRAVESVSPHGVELWELQLRR